MAKIVIFSHNFGFMAKVSPIIPKIDVFLLWTLNRSHIYFFIGLLKLLFQTKLPKTANISKIDKNYMFGYMFAIYCYLKSLYGTRQTFLILYSLYEPFTTFIWVCSINFVHQNFQKLPNTSQIANTANYQKWEVCNDF